MMNRETSYHRACSSPGHHYQKFQKISNYSPANYSSPPSRPSIIQRNLCDLSASDLLLFAKLLKHPGITNLRLSVSPAEQEIVSQRFGNADQRTTDNLFSFIRALANAIEGWMQTLELGVCLGLRDINSLCPAIGYSKTLRHLSFANSGLGDAMLQLLSSALQNCLPLRTLNLSGCALTDASSSAVAKIVKGEDPYARSLPQKYKEALPAEHRAPVYGRQWRQNVILMGKWSPAPALGVSHLTCSTEQITSASTACAPASSLLALDLSCNFFTDALSRELCPVLYKRPPLRALNLRCNQMTRLGAKPVLDLMKELNVLSLVDMRGNKDESLLGVLENGEHYTTFSTFQAPFWMDPESLDPVIRNPKNPRSNVPEKKSRSTTLSRSKMREKQTKVTIAGQQPINVRGGGSCNNSFSRTDMNSSAKLNNRVPSRANRSPLSPSRASAEWGPNSQKYHSFHQAGPPYVFQESHEKMPDCNDRVVNRRFARPATSPATRSPGPWSTWSEKTIFSDKNSFRQTSSALLSPLRDQEYDGSRFISPTVLEPPREHPVQGPSFEDSSTIHDSDHIKEIQVNSKGNSNGFCRTYTNEARRSRSAVSFDTHGPGYSRDYHNHQDFLYRESLRHRYNYRRNTSAPGYPSRQWPASSAIHNGRSPGSQGKRFLEKSPIRCHHRCKLLKDVQEQQKKTVQKVTKAVQAKRPLTPHFNRMLPKALPLPEDKKELVEWNNFVNQMTQTLLNLKDGFSQLIGPTEGAIAVVAQQAATKLHQMPSSFFRSGMLRQLDRACRVLNSHVASFRKRQKENMRHLNAENQAPILCSEANKKESTEQASDHDVVGKHDTNHKTSRNAKHLGVQNNHQNMKQTQVPNTNPLVVKHLVMQDQSIDHPNVPPLSISKGDKHSLTICNTVSNQQVGTQLLL